MSINTITEAEFTFSELRRFYINYIRQAGPGRELSRRLGRSENYVYDTLRASHLAKLRRLALEIDKIKLAEAGVKI